MNNRKRKCAALFLAAVMACSCALVGCSGGDSQDMKADAFMEMAQQHIEDGDYASAKEVLERGFDQTGDARIAMMISDLADREERPEPATEESTPSVTEMSVPQAQEESVPQETVEQESVATEWTAPQDDLLAFMNEDERYEVNIFLSNFCEQQFASYPAEDYDLLDFAFRYSVINAPGLLSYDGSVAYMTRSNMDALLHRFFGTTLELGSAPARFQNDMGKTVTYDGASFGCAMDPLGDTGYAAVARSMTDNGDGTFLVDFGVWHTPDSGTLRKLYYASESEAASIGATCVGYGRAVIWEYTMDNGRQTYHLQSYEGPQGSRTSVPETPDNLISWFSADRRHTVNIFLSNFCEQYLPEYPTSDYNMLKFAYLYAKINSHELLTTEPEYYCLSRSDADTILNRFFGCTVSPENGPFVYETEYWRAEILFEDGKYKFIAADGEAYNDIANAYEMTANGDGTYDVYFDIYSVDYSVYFMESLDRYYSIEPGELWRYPELLYKHSGHAVVRDYVTEKGYETYQLISYEVYS